MSTPYDQAAVKSLQTYLKAEVEEFNNNVFDEWPYHGDEMDLPTCSIMTAGTPVYLNLQPYIYRQEADPDNSDNDLIYEAVAQLDGRLQVDIWTQYKKDRGQMLELVTKAINKQNIESDLPNGLSLEMAEYHNVIARFDQVGYTYIDTEEGSQKSQWRVKIELLFSHVVIEVKSRPRISEITLTHQISDDRDVSDDNTDIEEIIDVLGE